jgi:hypothetical protein
MLRIGWSGRTRTWIAAVSAILFIGALGSPAVAERTPASTQQAFNFDTGNAPVEIIFPAVQVPERKYISTDGSDAPQVIDYVMALEVTWFDAIAPYHPTAIGVYTNLGRRPRSEATNRNRNIAILYSSYRILMDRIPQAAADWRAMMESVGLNPDDAQENTTTPVGLGNLAAKGMLAARLHDGLNRTGTAGGRKYNLEPFRDYTGYKPVNTPYELRHPSRWQPRILPSTHGNFVAQTFQMPQMGYAKPIAFSGSPSQFSLPPLPRSYYERNPRAYKQQVDEVLTASANMTDWQKMVALTFNDKFFGIGALGGYGAILAGNLDLERFVHYIATVEVATYDATVAGWWWKRHYDNVRPVSAIRFLYGNEKITAWGGPGKGTVNDITGNEWRSYLNTAAHPDYPSGSTILCHSYAQAARLFLGKDETQISHTWPAGSSTVEPGITPKADLTVQWNTWSKFAEDCGMSRFWVGVHFKDAITLSAPWSKRFGTFAYNFIQARLRGTGG